MKTIVKNRISWVIPAIAAMLLGSAMPASYAADAAKPEKAAKVKTKSKTVYGTIATASATMVKLTTKEGDMTSSLVPATEYYRVNEDVPVADLKTGDMVKFPLRGTDGLPTVQAVAPLTLKFGGEATLTFTDSSNMKLDRVTKIMATDLVAGQEVKVANNVFPDGKIEAREVWVTIPAPKAEAKPKT